MPHCVTKIVDKKQFGKMGMVETTLCLIVVFFI